MLFVGTNMEIVTYVLWISLWIRLGLFGPIDDLWAASGALSQGVHPLLATLRVCSAPLTLFFSLKRRFLPLPMYFGGKAGYHLSP